VFIGSSEFFYTIILVNIKELKGNQIILNTYDGFSNIQKLNPVVTIIFKI